MQTIFCEQNALNLSATFFNVVHPLSHEEYQLACRTNIQTFAHNVANGEADQQEHEAGLADAQAGAQAADAEAAELAAKIAQKDAEATKAKREQAARAKECAQDQDEMETIGQQLRKAADILREATTNKGNVALVQQQMTQVIESLSVVMSASTIDEASKSKLASLLQADDDDEGSSMPQGVTQKYDTHSRGIMDLISELNAQNEKDLQDSRRSCSEDNHNFNMIIQAAEQQKAADTDSLGRAKAQAAESKEAAADSASALKSTKDQLDEDRKVAAATKEACDEENKTQEAEQAPCVARPHSL